MRERKLGNTGLQVSQVGFGAIKLPEVPEAQASDALNAALDLGMNFVDTARNYRDSERKIGRAIGHRRGEFHLATKSSARDGDGLRRDLETSLRELRMERIDLYQLHTVSSEEAWQRVMSPHGALAAARRARDEGLIDHIGVSIHRDLGVMQKAIHCGEFETIMVCYSPTDAEHVAPEILPLARERGLGAIIMKALSGGMLVSEGFERGRRAGEEDPLVTQCLRFVLSHAAVSCVIPGMRNVEEVRQNARVGEEFQPMADEERRQLMEAIGRKGGSLRYGQTCLQCGYCQPCPEGVPISEIFHARVVVESYPDHLKERGCKLYESLESKADACTECRECVEKCPAGLDIPRRLREAATVLSR